MASISILIASAPADCWSCGAETELVTRVHVRRAVDPAECAISDLTEYPALADELMCRLSGKPSIGAIRRRHSKTAGREYMSNGCAHCDALFGDFFEVHARNFETPLLEFEPRDADAWGRFADALIASSDGHLFHY